MHTQEKDLIICKNNDFFALRSFLARYTKRAYFVGGCVRDSLLGLDCYDYDIEIYDILPDFFDELMKKLGAKGVGKSFFVYKYGCFDLALARSESKSGYGHKGFEVKICNDERVASSRRDFTINSIMCNIFTGEILDFYSGREDLKSRILRITNQKAFCEDSLRVLRAVQFVARFDLRVDEKSLEIMKSIDISDLSYERIRVELEKLFKAKNLKKGLILLRDLGLDERIFGLRLSDEFINKSSKKVKFTKNPLSFAYELFCEYSVILKGFEIVAKQEVIKQISVKKMLEIAIKTPLKNWLGINNQKRKNLALRLGVWEHRLALSLDENELKKMDKIARQKAIKKARQRAIFQRLQKLSEVAK